MSIKAKIKAKQKKLQALVDDITQLRFQCPHPEVIKTARANTGNWCKDDDHYWYEFICEECGTQWQEEQSAYNERMRDGQWVWEKERKIRELK